MMIEALMAGMRDPETLAEMAKAKLPELRRALDGRFDDHHASLCSELLGRIDHLDQVIDHVDTKVDLAMAPYADQRDRLDTIPGVGKRAAEVIIAEIGVDMGCFPTAAHLASWAGMCPGKP